MGAFVNVPADLANAVMLEVVVTAHAPQADASSQEIVNVYHLARNGGGPGSPNLLTVGNAVISVLNGVLPAVLSVDYTDATATIRMLDDPTALAIDLTAVLDGTVAGDCLPTFNAVSMDIITDARGRCFRGRKHYGPIAEASQQEGELVAGAVTDWVTAQTAIQGLTAISDGAGNTYALCVLSRINSNLIGPGVYFTYAKMTSCSVSERLGTMKRRKEGVGA